MSRIILCAALLLALWGCQKKSETTEQPAQSAPAQTTAATASITDRTWVLTELAGAVIVPDVAQPIFIKLGADDTSLTGNTGCNQLSGIFMHSADTLVFAHMATTKMACAGAMERETQFLAALEAAVTFHLRDGDLELCDAAGNVIVKFAGK